MHTLLVRGGKLIVAIAASWALGASLYIFSRPITVRGVRSVIFRDSSTVFEAFSREQSWYEAQGLWGILWLVVFSGIFLAAVRFAWRGKYKALAIISAVALALSIVSGFSIGGAYLPAALGLFVGTVMLLSTRLMASRR